MAWREGRLAAKENVIHEMIKDARESEDHNKAYDLERELRQVESTKLQVVERAGIVEIARHWHELPP